MRRLLAFDDWANGQVMRALVPLDGAPPAAVALMAHVMAAKRIWFARVTLGTPPFTVHPDLTLPAIVEHLRLAHEEWLRYLDDLTDADLEREVHYATMRGDRFSNTLGDILTHLGLHGQHHRGQCCTAIRAAGAVPPGIDFITAARTGAV